MITNIISQKYVAAVLLSAALCFGVFFAAPQSAAATAFDSQDEMRAHIAELLQMIAALQEKLEARQKNTFFTVAENQITNFADDSEQEVFEVDWLMQNEDVYVNSARMYVKPDARNKKTKPWNVFESAVLYVDGVALGSTDLQDKTKWRLHKNTGRYIFDVFEGNVRIDASTTPEFVIELTSTAPHNNDSWLVGIPFRGVTLWNASAGEHSVGRAMQYAVMHFGKKDVSDGVAELSISESTDNPEAMVFEVDEDDESDELFVLGFQIEEENGVGVTIEDMRFEVEVESNNLPSVSLGEVIEEAVLYHRGTEVAAMHIFSNTSKAGQFVFGNIGVDIEAYETEDFSVKLKVAGSDNYAGSARVYIEFDSVLEAEDENGYDEDDMVISGTAEGNWHTLLSGGAVVEVTDIDTAVEDVNGDVAGGNRGVFEIELEVTAFGDDIYILNSYSAKDGSIQVAVLDSSEDEADGDLVVDIHSSADTENGFIRVDKGSTESIEISVTFEPEEDGAYHVELTKLPYVIGSVGGSVSYTHVIGGRSDTLLLDASENAAVYTAADITEIYVERDDADESSAIATVSLEDGSVLSDIEIVYPSGNYKAALYVAAVLKKEYGFDFSEFDRAVDRANYLKSYVTIDTPSGQVEGVSVSVINYTQAAAILLAIEEVIDRLIEGL